MTKVITRSSKITKKKVAELRGVIVNSSTDPIITRDVGAGKPLHGKVRLDRKVQGRKYAYFSMNTLGTTELIRNDKLMRGYEVIIDKLELVGGSLIILAIREGEET